MHLGSRCNIGYWSSVDSLLWDVESTLELDSEGASIPMGLSSYTLLAWVMRVGLTLHSFLCIRVFW